MNWLLLLRTNTVNFDLSQVWEGLMKGLIEKFERHSMIKIESTYPCWPRLNERADHECWMLTVPELLTSQMLTGRITPRSLVDYSKRFPELTECYTYFKLPIAYWQAVVMLNLGFLTLSVSWESWKWKYYDVRVPASSANQPSRGVWNQTFFRLWLYVTGRRGPADVWVSILILKIAGIYQFERWLRVDEGGVNRLLHDT